MDVVDRDPAEPANQLKVRARDAVHRPLPDSPMADRIAGLLAGLGDLVGTAAGLDEIGYGLTHASQHMEANSNLQASFFSVSVIFHAVKSP